MDSLIEHLVQEISFDAEYGTAIDSLSNFISSFYTAQNQMQTVDLPFVAFVLFQLVQTPHIRLAVVQAKNEHELPEASTSALPADEQDDEDVKDVRGKGKAKAKGKKVPTTTQGPKLRILDPDELATGIPNLLEQHGDDLRLVATPEASWAAVTGSYSRPSALTDTVWRVVQAVSRARDGGMPSVELGQQLGFDPKLLFHLLRVAVQLGIVHKIKLGNTNKIVHVRYLSQNKDWQLAAESGVAEEQQAADSEDDNDDATKVEELLRYQLKQHKPLIMRKLVHALQSSENGESLPFRLFGQHIGFKNPGAQTEEARSDRRLVSDIIRRMTELGIVATAMEEDIKVLRLVDASLVPSSVASIAPAAALEDYEDDVEGDQYTKTEGAECRGLGEEPMDWQIIQLLAEADVVGLTVDEIAARLGGISHRIVDFLLLKLDSPTLRMPPYLSDYRLRSTIETIGRQKSLRYYLQGAFERMLAQRGVQQASDSPVTEEAGGWRDLSGETFYIDAADLARIAKAHRARLPSERKENSNWGKAGKIAATGRHPASGKPATSATTAAAAATGTIEGDGIPAKKRGRPRKPDSELKRPRKGTVVTKKDDDAAESVGTPAAPEPTAKGKGKGKKREQANDVEEAGPANKKAKVADVAPPAPEPPKKRRGRPPKDPSKGSVREQRERKLQEALAQAQANGGVLPEAFGTPAPQAAAHAVEDEPLEQEVDELADEEPEPERERSEAAPAVAVPTPIEEQTVTTAPLAEEQLKLAPAVEAQVTAATPEDLMVVEADQDQEDRAPVQANAQKRPEPPAATDEGKAAKKPRKEKKEKAEKKVKEDKKVKGERKERPKAPKEARINIRAMQREQDIMAYVEQGGGKVIIDLGMLQHLSDKEAADLNDSDYKMDRGYMLSNVRRLVEAGRLKMTAVTVDAASTKSGHEIRVLYLPTVDLAGPEVQLFLAETTANAARLRRPELGPPLDFPTYSAQAAVENVRPYFLQQGKIAANRHGYQVGKFARARTLHHAVMAYLSKAADDDANVAATWDSGAVVIRDQLLTRGLQLKDLLLLHKIPAGSPELDKFLADPANAEKRPLAFPAEVRSAFRVRDLRASFTSPIFILVFLGIATPMCADGAGSFTSTSFDQATHWKFAPRTSSLGYTGGPFTSPDAIDFYWSHLRSFVQSDEAKSKDVQPAATAEVSKNFWTQHGADRAWSDKYHLFAQQEQFLRDVFREHGASMFANLAERVDEVKALAADILAPASVVGLFLQQLSRSAQPTSAARQAPSFDETLEQEKAWSSIVASYVRAHPGVQVHEKAARWLRTKFMAGAAGFTEDVITKELDCASRGGREGHAGSILPAELLVAEPRSPIKAPAASRPRFDKPSAAASARPLTAPKPGVGNKKLPRGAFESADGLPELPSSARSAATAGPSVSLGVKSRADTWRPEQDELLLDAVAIAKAKTALYGIQMSWKDVQKALPQRDPKELMARHHRLVQSKEVLDYEVRLVSAWVDHSLKQYREANVFALKADELDIVRDVRLMRAKIDKNAIRLARLPIAQQPATQSEPTPPLPESVEEIRKMFGGANGEAPWELLPSYFKGSTASVTREREMADTSYSLPAECENKAKMVPGLPLETTTAEGAIKMLLATPDTTYAEEAGTSFLLPLKEVADAATKRLITAGVVARNHPDPNRRNPGRNFILTQAWLGLFGSGLSEMTVAMSAQDGHSSIDELIEGDHIALQPEDKDMAALLHLVSNNALESASVDTSTTHDMRHSLELTKAATDEHIELPTSLVVSKAAGKKKAGQLRLPVDGATAVPQYSGDASLAANASLLSVLKKAGPSGMSSRELKAEVPMLADYLPTLFMENGALWAGSNEPVVVSHHFASDWTVAAVDGTGSPSGTRVLPASWLDIYGSTLSQRWDKALGYVFRTISSHPGLTLHRLHDLAAAAGHVMSLVELIRVIQALENSRWLARQASGQQGARDGEDDLAAAHFFATA